MLIAKNICKKYEGKTSSFEIKNLNISFDNKGMTFICGDSGSGKSTLLNILSTLESVDSGSLFFNGINLLSSSDKKVSEFRKKHAGFIFQNYNLYDDLTVAQNILIQLEINGLKEKEYDIETILKRVGLLEFKDKKVSNLSGGQKQRVGIARALVKNPSILFCDEPTGALDSKTSEEIFELLKEISKDILIIVVSHDLESVNKYGDRIIRIEDGEVISDSCNEKDTKHENPSFTLKNSRTPSKAIRRMAFMNFWKKPTNLVTSILLSFGSLSLMNVAFSFESGSKDSVVANAIKGTNFNYLKIERELNAELINSGSLTKLKPGFSSNLFDGVLEFGNGYYSAKSYRYFSRFKFATNVNSDNFQDAYRIKGACEINDDFCNNFGLNIAYGALPETKDEIAITQYQFENFVKLGAVIDGENKQISNYSDLINQNISLYNATYEEDFTFKITAIVDSGVTSAFKDILSGENLDYFNANYVNGLDKCVFLSSQGIEQLRTEHTNSLSTRINVSGDDSLFENGKYTFNQIDNAEHASDVTYFNSENLNLDENSCLISFNALNISGDENSVCNISLLKLVQKKNPYYTKINPLKTGSTLADFHHRYLVWTNDDSLTDDEFKNAFEEEIVNQIKTNQLKPISLINWETNSFEIIGIYYPETDLSQKVSIAFENKTYQKIVGTYNSEKFDISAIYFAMNNNSDSTLKFINKIKSYFNENSLNYDENYLAGALTEMEYVSDRFVVDNLYYGLYEINSSLTTNIQTISVIAAITLGLFSVLFLYLFYNSLADRKEKEIAIFRTLGATKSDVFKTFFIQNICISVVNTLLSFGGASLLIVLLRSIKELAYISVLNLVNFSILAFVLTAVISLVECVVGMIIPCCKIIKKSPIDAIRCEE